MRFAFIVNPVSGQGHHDMDLLPEIDALIAGHPDEDIKTYTTLGVQDANVLADAIATEAEENGTDVVIFACGGDGTIQETANGVYGHDNASLGVIPIGSGNDFVRQLIIDGGGIEDYLDLEKQLQGESKVIDLLRLSWSEDGEEKSRLVANGVNIGFDGNCAILASELKELPIVSGTGAYMLSVLSNLIRKKGQNLHIVADGEKFHEGPLLLATAGNGGYCGGGVRSCPNADLSDGLIELMAIKNVQRMKFLKLFPAFKDGKILEAQGAKELVTYKQSKDIMIEPLAADTMRFVADGEILETGALHIETVPNAIKVWTV